MAADDGEPYYYETSRSVFVDETRHYEKNRALTGKVSPLLASECMLMEKVSVIMAMDDALMGKDCMIMEKVRALMGKVGTLMAMDDVLMGKVTR